MRSFKKHCVPKPKQGACISIKKLKAPFDLEIGCGTGEFAIEWSKKTLNPMIAIEKTRTRFLKFEKKYKELGKPTNLWPIHTNAVWWLAHYGKPASFEHIFLLYPNPYPKKKQSDLRWVNCSFMPFLLDLLKKGGELQLRTNQRDYYVEFKEQIKSFAFMYLKEDRKRKDPLRAQSLFERKYLQRGEVCHILKYQKA